MESQCAAYPTAYQFSHELTESWGVPSIELEYRHQGNPPDQHEIVGILHEIFKSERIELYFLVLWPSNGTSVVPSPF